MNIPFLAIKTSSLLRLLPICLLWCYACKTVNRSIVKDGPHPQFLDLSAENSHYTYFKIEDLKNQKIYPAQKWNNHQIIFFSTEKSLPNKKELKIVCGNQPFFEDKVKITEDKNTGDLAISKANKLVFKYQVSKKLPHKAAKHYERSGFIHPFYSPKGKILTDGFPEGHTHQHGVFFAFVNTTYKGEKVDFWNQHQGTGTIAHTKVINYQSGSVYAHLVTEQAHISIKHDTLLKEIWDLKIYNTEPFRVDLETTIHSVAADTLFINQYHYGGMAARGTKVWNKVDSLNFQNEPVFISSEEKDRVAANHSRPTWSGLQGLIDGKNSGLILMGNPSNYRFPEPVRIHPTMPYFCLAPMVENGFFIPPNGVFKANYALISFDEEVPIDFLSKFSFL